MFDNISLIRECGRSGAKPRRRIELYGDEDAARAEFERRLRGYRP